MSQQARLPVLDLSALDQGEPATRRFRDDLRRATHEFGFFHLTGHGVPDEVVLHAFSEARTFFALPLEEKISVEMTKSPHFRG